MTLSRIEDRQLDPNTLARLTQNGPVIVTHDGTPVYVVHQTTPEWMEALDIEENEPGDMRLEDYANLYGLSVDTEAYLREFPEDAPYSVPPSDEN